MQLFLNRVGKIFSQKDASAVFWIADTDSYVFVSDKGVECKIQQTSDGRYSLALLCLEHNHIDPGKEAEIKYDFFSSLESLEERLHAGGFYIEWGEGDCFSTSAVKYNTIGKVMSGDYKGCRCLIENNNGQLALFVFKNEGEDCEEVMFFDGFEEMKKNLSFIVEF